MSNDFKFRERFKYWVVSLGLLATMVSALLGFEAFAPFAFGLFLLLFGVMEIIFSHLSGVAFTVRDSKKHYSGTNGFRYNIGLLYAISILGLTTTAVFACKMF